MLQFQAVLRVGLPTTMRKEHLKQRASATATTCYRFRTLRGEIVVTLEGNIHSEPLTYSGQVRVAKEGDLILF